MSDGHEWFEISFTFGAWIECRCGFKPESQHEMDNHVRKNSRVRNSGKTRRYYKMSKKHKVLGVLAQNKGAIVKRVAILTGVVVAVSVTAGLFKFKGLPTDAAQNLEEAAEALIEVTK